MADEKLLEKLAESRQAFLAAVEEVRPDLHRYCARMTGSVFDGEDVVQDVLARAYFELPTLKALPALRGWLFRMAHNRAIDLGRRYERRMGEPLEAAMSTQSDGPDPEDELARRDALRLALSQFLHLAPAQRSCVVLKDVLGHSVSEIGAMLDMTESAVSSALHRGRAKLRTADDPQPDTPAMSHAVLRYAQLFNARDWDGVRDMLVDDVRLDLVSVFKREGRDDVGQYFTNYDRIEDWHLVPGWLDGREVVAVMASPEDEAPRYFIELQLDDQGVRRIRDFRYVPYVAQDARFVHAPQPTNEEQT